MRFLRGLLFVFILFGNSLYAYDGEKKIRLMGNVKDDISKRISVKELEHPFELLELNVYNPYEKRSDLYKGIFLDQLVRHYAKEGITSVTLKAIDDYEITISKESWTKHRIMLSTQVNGDYISIKKKGPLRIVCPDVKPKTQAYKDLLPIWVWMITKIEFK